MSIYTMEQWTQDGEFMAAPGQRIDEEIYNGMMNRIPPLDLPAEKARQALEQYNVPVHAGFLMGEPHSCSPDGQHLYLAFGMNNYGKGPKFFYLGLSHRRQPVPDGAYYFMDCMNADVTDRLYPVGDFDGDGDAIQTAADYEATLYRYEYRDGERVSSAVIYDPFTIFED